MNDFIDTHAHIYDKDFAKDREAVLHRCAEQGIHKIFMPNVDHTTIDAMLEVEYAFANTCIAMMGVHPCSIKKGFEKELYLVEAWLTKRKFAAIGEIGTDLYWDKSFFEQQKEALIIQINWARKFDMPVVIHCRESMDQTIELLENLQDGSLRGVFHCFTGNLQQAVRVTKLGFYLGIGGVATFKNGGLDTVIKDLRLDNVVLETDSPYLAPVPYRGKRNEPSYIPIIAEKVATLKDCSVDEVRKITTRNALNLFNVQDESQKSQH